MIIIVIIIVVREDQDQDSLVQLRAQRLHGAQFVAEVEAAVADLLILKTVQVTLALHMEHLAAGAAPAEHHLAIWKDFCFFFFLLFSLSDRVCVF